MAEDEALKREALQEQFERKSTKFLKCLTCMGNPTKEKTHFSSRDPNTPPHKKEKLRDYGNKMR
jgi:hypothetical protein